MHKVSSKVHQRSMQFKNYASKNIVIDNSLKHTTLLSILIRTEKNMAGNYLRNIYIKCLFLPPFHYSDLIILLIL